MPSRPTHPLRTLITALGLIGALGGGTTASAADPAAAHAHPPVTHAAAKPAAHAVATPEAAPATSTLGRLKAVIERHSGKSGNVSLIVGDRVIASTVPGTVADAESGHLPDTLAPRAAKAPTRKHASQARAATFGGHAAHAAHTPVGSAPKGKLPWGYEGANGPANWANVQPGFGTCATGERQSPVHIQSTDTLQGPAEALQFDYLPSGGSVVNNGQTIQVDLDGSNTLTVRGTAYRLVEFHFHHPAEEKVNGKGFAMVAHLVHQSAQGQLATLAVLIEPGEANALIDKVWTHMPLEVKDRVALPADLLDMKQLLPTDQRYYQYLGSLTTPPCTEGVLWIVMKQPMTVSPEQLRLFAQLFPMNARPTQPLHGRVVREAM